MALPDVLPCRVLGDQLERRGRAVRAVLTRAVLAHELNGGSGAAAERGRDADVQGTAECQRCESGLHRSVLLRLRSPRAIDSNGASPYQFPPASPPLRSA